MDEYSKKSKEDAIRRAEEKQNSPLIESNVYWYERKAMGYVTALHKHGEGYKNFKPRVGEQFQIDDSIISAIGKDKDKNEEKGAEKAESESVPAAVLPEGCHWVESVLETGDIVRYISEDNRRSALDIVKDEKEDDEHAVPMKKRSHFTQKRGPEDANKNVELKNKPKS